MDVITQGTLATLVGVEVPAHETPICRTGTVVMGFPSSAAVSSGPILATGAGFVSCEGGWDSAGTPCPPVSPSVPPLSRPLPLPFAGIEGGETAGAWWVFEFGA